MAKVDPFLVPIPDEFLKDRQLNGYFQYLNRFLHDLWARTGGGSDFVENNITNITNIDADLSSIESRVTQNENDIDALQGITGLTVTTTSSNVTTTTNQYIRATAELTVTLNTSPSDYENVYVQPQGDYQVTISGNINDQSSDVIFRAYDVVNYVYYSVLGEWVRQ